jgi:hypothetical protein
MMVQTSKHMPTSLVRFSSLLHLCTHLSNTRRGKSLGKEVRDSVFICFG